MRTEGFRGALLSTLVIASLVALVISVSVSEVSVPKQPFILKLGKNENKVREENIVKVTEWRDSENKKPTLYHEIVVSPFKVELVYQSKFIRALTPGPSFEVFYVLVNSALYPFLENHLVRYAEDVAYGTCMSVSIFSGSWGAPENVRSFLKNGLCDNLVGALLIGNISAAWFEIENDHGEYGYKNFPTDLYYMDLTGTWIDSDNNGIFDNHVWDNIPDIYIGRLKADILNDNEITLLRGYFDKNHNYRTGNLILPRRALVYVDDDWYYWADEWSEDVGLVYETRTLVNDKEVTRALDYKQRLTQEYEWVSLFAHSSSWSHSFQYNNGQNWDSVSYSEIHLLDPKASFYNLYSCSAARYTESDYIGGWYIFANTYGLAVIGSTKIGSMLYFHDFYEPLSWGKNLGQSFKEWFTLHGWTSRDWFYGMVILGDPTLKVSYRVELRDENGNFVSGYDIIQPAIDSASPGYTIIVDPGTYEENLIVDVYNLTIRSSGGADETIVKTPNPGNSAFWVITDNVTIDGFTVKDVTNGGPKAGILVDNADNCNVLNNIAENNYYGILLQYSDNNRIYHNNLINNTNQAHDNGTNYWDDGYPSGGNYWSDYAGVDNYWGENQNIPGGDGIGDTPYDIPMGTNQDRYPLMNPVSKGVEVSILPSYQSAPPEATLAYTVTVTNTGNVIDNYDLSVGDNASWGPSVSPESLIVLPGTSDNAMLRVTVPENAVPSTEDSMTVTVTSQTDNTVSDNDLCMAHVLSPKAEFSLTTLYKVSLDVNLYLENGSKLVVKFYTYGDAFENENVFWSGTTPTHVEKNESVPHPEGIGVKKVRLNLTTDNTENVISTIASFVVRRDDLFGRIMAIKGEWPYASPDERNALFNEIMDIKGQWPYAPT